MMKKYIKKTTVIVFVFLLFGCDLDDPPIGKISRDQINTEPTKSSVNSLVNSSYQLLSNTLNIMGDWDWDGGKVLRNDFILQDIAAGDMNKKWNPDGDQAWMDEIGDFNFTSMNPAFNGLWSYDFEGISRVNLAIMTLSDEENNISSIFSEEEKDRLLGEVYFLRAFYYFDLVTNFGGVPLMDKPLEDFSDAYSMVSGKETEENIFKFIGEDLNKAVQLLPKQKYSSDSQPWRISIGAAKAMQAKVSLFQGEWGKAVSYIEELQAWGFYSLNSNYFDAFDVEKKFKENEVIFAYNHQEGQSPNKGNGIAALIDWGFVAPTQDFINSFEDNDPRLNYTVDIQTKTPYKLLGSTDSRYKGNDDSPGNKIFIRYADVLLWKSEALIQLDQIEEGVKIIDEIRLRAMNSTTNNGGKASNLTMFAGKGLSKKEAEKILQNERRNELGFESHRFNDLKRWGIAKETLKGMGKNFEDYNMLYPIPQGEIDKSGGQLEQNPGY